MHKLSSSPRLTPPKLHKLKPVLKLALPDLGPDEDYTCRLFTGKPEGAGVAAPTAAPPLLSPLAGVAARTAPGIPPTLSLSQPKTPVSPVSSFSNRRQRNAKQLFLHVPAGSSGAAGPSATASTSKSGLHLLTEPPLSPGALDLSETRSCPPTPRLLISADNNDEEMIDVEKREELKVRSVLSLESLRRQADFACSETAVIAARRHHDEAAHLPAPPEC